MLEKSALSAGLCTCIGFAFLSACGTDAKRENVATNAAALTDSATTIPWGKGFVLREAAPESPARGPSAIAIGDDGRVVVADAEAGRIAIVSGLGTGAAVAETFAPAPKDVRDLAIASDGAVAFGRSMNRDVTVLEPEGTESGTLRIAPGVGDIDSLGFAISRRVIVHTSFQESYAIGSAHAPMALESTLIGKKEGVFSLAGNRTASVVRNADGSIALRVHAGSEIAKTIAIGNGESARIVGARGDVACTKIEHVSGAVLVVTREVVCTNVTTGAAVLKKDLGAPGLYVPHHELALGGGKLAFMKPTEAGLSISLTDVEGAR